MIITAGVLALTSSLLTALGMAELFQGLFIVFLVIDLGRFLVLNFLTAEWKNLRLIKWVLTFILAILFIYSAVGVYNKLNSMIPASVQTAMIEAANYNKAADNAEIKYNRSEDLASIAQTEYTNALQWNQTDYNNCITRAQSAKDIAVAENKCNNTKRRLDKQASTNLKQALANADVALDQTAETSTANVKNQSELAGILTTVCKIIPNNDCKSLDGLQNALTIIILLTICGLDYLQLGIVLAVNTRKSKKDNKSEKNCSEKNDNKKITEIVVPSQKKVRKPSKNKLLNPIVNENLDSEKNSAEIEENISTPPENPVSTPVKKVRKLSKFSKATGFYK